MTLTLSLTSMPTLYEAVKDDYQKDIAQMPAGMMRHYPVGDKAPTAPL